MGLGKTVQLLALFSLIKRSRAGEQGEPHLLIAPASLLGNWRAEARRFTPHLRWMTAHSSAVEVGQLTDFDTEQLKQFDVVVTSYGTAARLAWMEHVQWSVIALDEAQAIKNPTTLQSRKVKSFKSRVRIALTGTPVENRLGDLWSLFDFLCPGLLGNANAFTRYCRILESGTRPSYGPLRQLVQPYLLRRLKSDKNVINDLPDKIDMPTYCTLSKTQVRLYQQIVTALAEKLTTLTGIERRGAVLTFLIRLKQICNHPSQWLGDNTYALHESGKFERLKELAEEIASRQEKVLVFTQFREITEPLAEFLRGIFKRPGLVLHGDTPIKLRHELVKNFQMEQGPPFFVLSLRAGGSGLNLSAACHVIHFDRWWNPAVENQATDRAHRIGQTQKVLVHKFICQGTMEEKIDAMISAKKDLANQVIEGGGETLLTEMSDQELLRTLTLDVSSALGEN
jgi:non-specific serine/threonine protein kinase